MAVLIPRPPFWAHFAVVGARLRRLTGAVHLLDFSEKASKGLAVWPHQNGFPKPHLTSAGELHPKLKGVYVS